jgi:predicted nucleotidyltransferase
VAEHNVEVDDAFFDVLSIFSEAAKTIHADWLVVGATARIMLLEKLYGLPQGRATQDIDFGVQVGDWEQYRALCELLTKQGVVAAQRNPTKRFRTKQDRVFDLVPYGGVEDKQGRVFWPPEHDDVMTVRGFDSAAHDAIAVTVNKALTVPVASPRGLCALKLFAWQERHTQHPGRDAQDIAYIIRHIEALYPADKLFNEHITAVEQADYVIQHAGMFQLGIETAAILTSEEQQFLATFIAAELAQEDDSVFCREIQRYTGTTISTTIEFIQYFHSGLTNI